MGGQCRIGPHGRGELVRGIQDQLPTATVHRERVARGRRSVSPGEVAGEVEDVAGRRTSPAVDRLARIADRCHRMPRPRSGSVPRRGPAAGWPVPRRCPGTHPATPLRTPGAARPTRSAPPPPDARPQPSGRRTPRNRARPSEPRSARRAGPVQPLARGRLASCSAAYSAPVRLRGAPPNSAVNRSACPRSEAGSTRCERNSADSSNTRWATAAGRSRDNWSRPGVSATTLAASRKRAAVVIRRELPSIPSNKPCSVTSRPARHHR